MVGMELLVCIFSTFGMAVFIGYIVYLIYRKLTLSNGVENFCGCLAFYLVPLCLFGLWIISGSVTLSRKELPKKLSLARDTIKMKDKIIDSLKKENSDLSLKLYGRREKDLINSLSDEDYRAIFGEEKPSKTESGIESYDETVYICTGETSTKYHSDPDCRGLSRCSGEIEEISEEEAEDMGRTPCKICY